MEAATNPVIADQETPEERRARLRAAAATARSQSAEDLKKIQEVEQAMPKVHEVTPPKSQQQPQLQSGPSNLPAHLSRDPDSSAGSAQPSQPKLPQARVSKEERELRNFFTYQFGPAIIFILLIAFRNEDKAIFYAPTPEECEAIAPHAAKLTAKVYKWFNIPNGVHEAIVNSEDAFALAYVVYGYLDRTGFLDKFPSMFGMLFGGPIARSMEKRTGSVQPKEPPRGEQRSNGNGSIDLSSIRGLETIHIP